MRNDKRGVIWALIAGLGILLSAKKKPKTTTTKTPTTTTTPTLTGGGGGSSYVAPVPGFIITGVGQTVTGAIPQQTVTAPVRVINLQATPAGTYSGSVSLRTSNGTVLYTENLTNLNISSSGYPAIYFNPQNPVWNIPGAGVYTMLLTFTIVGVVYTRTVDVTLTNTDLGIGGTSGINVQDYSITNGNQVVLTLSGGTVGQTVTIQLKQAGTVVGTLTAAYANSMTITSSAYGYCDIFVDNTDLGGVYIPQQLSGTWTTQRAKAVNETQTLDLQFSKVGNAFVIADSNANTGWANVEYWHNATYLGSSIPNGYSVEPNITQHITKKRWSAGSWIGGDNDGINRQKAQLTFKIISA